MVTEVTRHEVQQLVARGAQLIEVLDAKEYRDAHLPGAVNLPLPELEQRAPGPLDRRAPTITYCYDSVCDMSARGAWRLEQLGFVEVYDYVASKMDWLGAGLPYEGERARHPTLASLAERDVPTCHVDERTDEVRSRLGEWDLCVVVNDQQVVVGLVRAEALGLADQPIGAVMQEGPRTFRPHGTAAELVQQIERSPQPWLLVTRLDGTLVGVTWPDQVQAAAKEEPADARA